MSTDTVGYTTPLGKEASQTKEYHSIEVHKAPLKNRCCKNVMSYRQKATIAEHLVYFCALSTASYFGVVTRIYLGELSQWNGVPLFHSLYPEIVGTAIMGFVGSHKNLLEDNHKAVYQAIATGLCGSITTFSSWNLEATNVLLQIDIYPIDNVARVIAWLTIILIGFGMPVAALYFGKHLARLSPWNDHKLPPADTNTATKKVEGVVFVIVWLVFTVVGIVVPYVVNRYDLLFSIVLSALGTYIRWQLSPLNKAFKHFRLGTFIVNIFGSWVLAAVAVSIRHLGTNEQDVAHQFLIGLGTGFCGCLTTVSTFAVELTILPLKDTYTYALCSIFLAQVGLIVVTGTYHWVNAS